jgi:hypothetical protein
VKVATELLSLLRTHLVVRRIRALRTRRARRWSTLPTLQHPLSMSLADLLTKMRPLGGVQAGPRLARDGRTHSARQGQGKQNCNKHGQDPLHALHFSASSHTEASSAR